MPNSGVVRLQNSRKIYLPRKVYNAFENVPTFKANVNSGCAICMYALSNTSNATRARSTTDITFTRGLTFERSSVVAPVVKLKYDVPKSPPNNNIRYKRKVVLSIPVEQKISHRHSLRLLRSSTFMTQDNLDCTVNADSQKVTGIGFGRSYDGEHYKRKTKYTETDRHVKSASDDSKHGNRSK
ncbi:unnamed protein product [Mytilus edulis]|uniref:Uncharacterized protein n=1 Tax=Mytilus edulis TaxID=6550 RepID=A0A8S3RS39_MYTED|nr:unnamed protein product [Mytilus edulis]